MRLPSSLQLRRSWLCDPDPTAPRPLRSFRPRKCVAPFEVVAAFRGQSPSELAADLGLDERYPLGSVTTDPEQETVPISGDNEP